MSLKSNLFKSDPEAEACQIRDAAHITPGAVGEIVSKIHTALFALDNYQVVPHELSARKYGSSTSAGVLAFKTKRRIINYTYQTTPDDIVGKMTITALDEEMFQLERMPVPYRVGSNYGRTNRPGGGQ